MTLQTTDTQSGAAPSENVFVAISACITVVSFALLWYSAYGLNHGVQLVYVNHWVDPNLYSHDPFVGTSNYYATLLWRVVAVLASRIPLGPLLLALMAMERFVAIYSAGRIAGNLASGSTPARVGGMIVMAVGPIPLLGAGTTMPIYFEQSGLAIAVLLGSVAAFLERKYLLWGILLGLSADFNAFYAVYAGAYFVAISLAQRPPARDVPKLAAASVLAILFAAPLVLLLLHIPPQHQFDQRLWWQAMQFRSPHHLMPLTWAPVRYAEYAVTTILLYAVWGFARRRTVSPMPTLGRFAFAVASVSMMFVAGSFVVAYAVHIPRLLTLQPIRGTDLGYCLTDICFVCFAARRFEQSGGSPRAAVGSIVLLLFACLWPLLPVAAMVISLAVGLGVYLVGTWVTRKSLQANRIRLATFACLTALGVAAIARPALTWRYTMFNAGDRWPVYGAADWAARATPNDTLFLLDADDDRTEPFRALSRRSVFVHVKDGTALFYDLGYLSTWCKRMGMAGYPLPGQRATTPPYPQWHDADAVAVHDNAGVNYWLQPRDRPTTLPVVWQDKTFKILDLGESTSVKRVE